jgi:transposase-like protein
MELSVFNERLGSPTEVVEKARRRRFTAAYKLEILKRAEACTETGQLGALLRREGLYSSHLTDWRAARERGELAGLAGQKRGPKEKPVVNDGARLRVLERENARLTVRAERAEALVELQKKVSELLSKMSTSTGEVP